MENVHEPNKCRIVCISQAIACEIGEVLRQRPVRPKHPQEVDEHVNGPLSLFNAFQARGSKRKRWNLTKTQKILVETDGIPHSWPNPIFCLQSPHRLEEIKRVRPQGHFGGYAI